MASSTPTERALTPVPTYTDATLTIPNSNPIILNAGGYAVSSTGSCGIWLTLGVSYRFVLQNSSNVQQWAVDNIPDSGVFNLPNTWTSLQTFNAGIAVPGTSTMGTVNITGNLSVTGASNLNTINAISNPTSLAQDSTITLNYDNLFSYIQLTKNLTVVPNSIGFANITQMSGTPGVHGAYGFYNVADFTSLAGKLAVGADTDTYFKDVGVTNANVLPSQANSATTEGSANFTSPVTSFQGVVVHLGSGVLNAAVNFLAPNNSNLGTGSIQYSLGFYGLDQLNTGTTLNAAFDAAPQTSCGGCYGFYSASANKDQMGNLSVTTLLSPTTTTSTLIIPGATSGSSVLSASATGGTLDISGPVDIVGTLQAPSITMNHVLISATAPTIASGFGSGAAVSNNNGTVAFLINVGTSNTGTGIITMPAANTGWNCWFNDITTKSANQAQTLQTASTSTSVTVQNYTDVMGTHVWTDSDILQVSCFAY